MQIIKIIQPKEKSKKILLWVIVGIAVLAALVVLYWYIFIYPKDEALKKANKPATSLKKFVVSGGKDFTKVNNNILPEVDGIIAKQGSKGIQVKQLQRYLNREKSAGIAEDGNWGPLTQSAFVKARFVIPSSASSSVYAPTTQRLESPENVNQPIYTVLAKALYDQLQLANY
jgi:peptidoglycan hydrolase-like protein with peptidoglycan-binding domain